MLKALNPSKEIKTFAEFKKQIKNPTEHYVIGVFDNVDNNLYKSYEQFTYKYPEDFNFFHTLHSSIFIESVKLKNLKAPSILVYYHDSIVTKKESNFRLYDNVSIL